MLEVKKLNNLEIWTSIFTYTDEKIGCAMSVVIASQLMLLKSHMIVGKILLLVHILETI